MPYPASWTTEKVDKLLDEGNFSGETMSHITIIRNKQPLNDTIFGKLYYDNELIGATAEVLWNGNRKGESCIPCGTYELVEHNSSKYGSVVAFVNPDLDVYHWEEDIPEEKRGKARSVCLIHAANWAHQLRGCVAVGRKVLDFGEPNGFGITSSRPTLNELRKHWGMRRGLTAKIRWE